jgi:hypothetical protein
MELQEHNSQRMSFTAEAIANNGKIKHLYRYSRCTKTIRNKC